MKEIVGIVMEFSPIGTCALIACAIVLFLVYGLLFALLAKVNILISILLIKYFYQ